MSAQVKEILDSLLDRLYKDVIPAFKTDPDYGNERIMSWVKNCNRQFDNELNLPLLAKKITSSASMNRSVYRAGYTDSHYFFEYVQNRIEKTIRSLLVDIENDDFEISEYKEEKIMERSSKDKPINLKNRKCFIVHGRDNAFKLEVARHLDHKGFTSIILHEQASGGRTVIEKLIKYAEECEFAIVLYTPDDEGGLVDSGQINKRARQNVIFEHGLTIGLMGRDKVFTLVSSDNIETPNDISGVVYIPQTNWKHDLDKEIHELGYVD